MVISVRYASSSVWQEVCKKVKDAAVFIDEAAGECLSWHGGFQLLSSSGAVSVKEFSSFESGENAVKGVFLVSTPLTGPTRVILRDVISNSRFQHCILITSCSPTVLTLASTGIVSENTGESTVLHKLETDMLGWMKNKDYVVEIFHLFISCVPISDTLFTFPQFSHMMPCFSEDLIGKTQYSNHPRNLDIEALPLELQVGIIHVMTTINSLLSKLNARESIYCMGTISSLVGSQLQKHSSSALRLKTAEHDMSLILLDRNFDLCGPLALASNLQNTLFDQIKAVLPSFSTHSVDVAVDMSDLCYGTSEESDGYTPVAFGCLHDPPSDWIDVFINLPKPEIVPYIYKKLADALSITDVPAKVTHKHLNDLVTSNFDKNYDAMRNHLSLLQAAVGVVNAFKTEKINVHDVIGSLQKMLLQSIAAENGTDEAMQYLIQVVLERRDRGLSVDSIFVVLVFVYSLIGHQFPVDRFLEKSLKDVVLEMMTEEAAKENQSCKLVQNAQEGKVEEFCEKIFFRLNTIKNSRKFLEKYGSITRLKDSACPLEYEGVINQLCYDLVDVTKPETPDLKYKANISIRNNFTSRFTMMLNSSKPHVMDNDIILVFVIGGITGEEIKNINNIFRLYGKHVIVGSTVILSPNQILNNLFLKDPLKPFKL